MTLYTLPDYYFTNIQKIVYRDKTVCNVFALISDEDKNLDSEYSSIKVGETSP